MKFKLLIALLFGLSTLLNAANGDEPSLMEKQLFETDHLASITKPTTLHYTFVKSGLFEEGFTDKIDIIVNKVHEDGSKDVSINFMTGNRRIPAPDLLNATGNPVLLYFLERDIKEMNRLTGGKPPYFRKRIRLAFIGVKESEPAEFIYGGKTLYGQQFEIMPYKNDPLKERFGKLEEKRYVFILSRDVPGYIYQIRTIAVNPNNPVDIIIEETLTLD